MVKYQNEINAATQEMIEDIDLVGCVFGQLNQNNQVYTYKAIKGIFNVGDIAAVMTKSGLKFVTIAKVDSKPTMPNPTYPLAWIHCSVNDSHIMLKAREASIVMDKDNSKPTGRTEPETLPPKD